MDDQIKRFVKLFIYANNHHRRIIDKKISKLGIYRSQHMLLMYLSRHQFISQKELADAFEISTSSVAVSLKKLEKGGYIEKAPDEADNRLNKVNITPKGIEAIEASHQIFETVDNAIFKGFTSEEIASMTGYWERLCNNMNEYEKELR